MLGDDDNGEYMRVWKASVVACLKILSQHSLGLPDERHETLHSG
jgi:hypothetical protein